tara:strand:+ start:869 stop:2326 length:1458 start_codon:yes stop_codon:yes gene_type:complete
MNYSAWWDSMKTWQPLIISIFLTITVAVGHYAYWEINTETDPKAIWDGQELTKEDNNWTIDFDQKVGDKIVFKGVLDTSPKSEVYGTDIITGKFSEGEGLVYSEDLHGKTMINIDGMRILVDGNLSGKFFVSEVVVIEAELITNTSYFEKSNENITLVREGWVAKPKNIELASDTDYYFFTVEILILAVGSYLFLKRIDNLGFHLRCAWHIAKFEVGQGIKSPRMIVLGAFFTLFIVGMGWLLGDLQSGDPESTFFVANPNSALQQLCFFTFFVVSLAAIGVSVDSFHKERQSNTLNLMLARPINRESIVLGKAIGLTLVVGIPAFVAQSIGLILMVNAGDLPTLSGIIAFFVCGQIMIFTMICFQLCFAVSAKSGTDVVIYGLGMWLLFAVVWNLIIYAISFAIGVDLTEDNFENDPLFQSIASHLGMLNPGYVYQFSVGLLTHRTLVIDLEGIPGWLVLLALVLWPITCLRIATWLFKREIKG